MPQRAMTRATAFPLQHTPSRQGGGRGAGGFPMTEEPSVDTQQPTHLKHTACNDWRHGCRPWGEKQAGWGGAQAPLPQQTLMAGAQ